jgi:NDP-sugar pyrophosphorylase family protein
MNVFAPDGLFRLGSFQHAELFSGSSLHGKRCRSGRAIVLTGSGCVIGQPSECKTAILLDWAKTPHFGYVGDSVLGSVVNRGTGTKLANFKIVPGLGRGLAAELDALPGERSG